MNTRKDNNGKALKQWRATAPALIEKPFRHIGNRTNGVDLEGRVVLSATFIEARHAADRGDGLTV